jgi:hypothetical protein
VKLVIYTLLVLSHLTFQTHARMVRADLTDDWQNTNRPSPRLALSHQPQVKPIVITETYNIRKKQNSGSGAFAKTLPMAVIHKQEALRYINSESSSGEDAPNTDSGNQNGTQGETQVIIIPAPFDDDLFFDHHDAPSVPSPHNKLEGLLSRTPVEKGSFDQVSFRVPASR